MKKVGCRESISYIFQKQWQHELTFKEKATKNAFENAQ